MKPCRWHGAHGHERVKDLGKVQQKHGFLFTEAPAALELLLQIAEELFSGDEEYQILYKRQDPAVHGIRLQADLKGSLVMHRPRHDATVVQGLACSATCCSRGSLRT